MIKKVNLAAGKGAGLSGLTFSFTIVCEGTKRQEVVKQEREWVKRR